MSGEEERGVLGFKVGPIRRLIRSRLKAKKKGQSVSLQDKVEKWRRDGIPEPMIEMAVEMADTWVYEQLKAIKQDKLRRGLQQIAPEGKKPKEEIIEEYKRAFLLGKKRRP